MNGEVVRTVVGIFTALIGLAILATLVSKNAKTGSVIQNVASGFGNDLYAAESPVSGGTMQQLSYATS